PPTSTPFPYTTLFRSPPAGAAPGAGRRGRLAGAGRCPGRRGRGGAGRAAAPAPARARRDERAQAITDRAAHPGAAAGGRPADRADRKSTRLNSSHVEI